MKKNLMTVGLLLSAICFTAQMKKTGTDTIRIQTIEDVNLHKTGNPNKAKPLSTKSNLTVMETPQPIAIVTHEIIEQQQARQLSDVIKNVNGIYITSSRGGSQDSFGGRGFIFGNDNIFKNGSRVSSGVFPEVTGLERVEVLKGANAMLYGNVGPGGIVNLITKKPKFEFGGTLGFSAGSWNSYKPTVDIYSPLSKNVAVRVNGAYEYAESFRDLVKSKKNYLNPSFLFNLSENTQLIVEGDYLYHNFTPDFGIGSVVDDATGISRLATEISRNQFLGTDWQYQTTQQATTDVILNHKFNKNWALNAVASYQNYTKDYFSTERIRWIYNSKDNNFNPVWARPVGKTYNEQNYTSLQINLNGEFKTGNLGHKLLVGTDGDYSQADTQNFKLSTTTLDKFFLNDPSTWINETPMPASDKTFRRRISTRRFGFYAQDLVELTKSLKVLAGVRYSYLTNGESSDNIFMPGFTPPKASPKTEDHAFSPKAGIIYNPDDNISVFATYTNSFVPNTGTTVHFEALKPSTVDQYEIGLKKNIFSNTVSFNVTAYQIINNNTYTTARFNADGKENSNTSLKEYAGRVRSRGAELDITGNPLSNLSLIGGISYNHAVYTETPDDVGYVENQRLVRTPSITANASVFYTFRRFARGLTIGTTAFYTGDRKAGWNDLKNQKQITRMIDVGGFTTIDVSLGYEWKKLVIQGKIGNLFDVVNYNVHENYSVNPISPRNYYFTLTYKL